MWSSPKKIAEILSTRSKKIAVLYYELAPTGKIHAGILRTLIRMDDLRDYLNNMSINAKTILGLADIVVLKEQHHFPSFNRYKNRQLIEIPNPITGEGSYYDYFLADIKKTIKYYNITIDRYEIFSTYYSKKVFDFVLPIICEKQHEIIAILSKYQKSAPVLFHPKCKKCNLVYHGSIRRIDSSGRADFHCSNCGYSSMISIANNKGLFPFKFETAIKWKLLNVDVQFVGQDHDKAIEASIEIYEKLFGECTVIPYFLNLTISENNEVVHKSLGNYRAVTDFSQQERCELREFLQRNKDSLLIKLPQKFRLQKQKT